MGRSRYWNLNQFLLFITIVISTTAIYVPEMSGPIKGRPATDTKQLEWQDTQPTTERIQVYQDYANVKIQQHQNADNLKQLYEQNNAQDFDSIPYRNPNIGHNQTRPSTRTGHYIVRNTTTSHFESTTIKNFDNVYAASSYNPYGNYRPNEYNPHENRNQPQKVPNPNPQSQFICTLNCRNASQNNSHIPPIHLGTNSYNPLPQIPQARTNPYYTPQPINSFHRPVTPINPYFQPSQYLTPPSSNNQQFPPPPRTSLPRPTQPLNNYPQQSYIPPTTRLSPINPSTTSTTYHFPHNFRPLIISPNYLQPSPAPTNVIKPDYYLYESENIITPQNYYSGKLQNIPRQTQPKNKCPQGTTGQFPYEHSCNQFLNCWNGRGIVQNCAPGTLFNPITLECDFPHKVNCISGPRTPKFERLIIKEEAICPREFSGIIPHYQDCSKFLQCNHGQQIEMNCPPGTLFDARTNICDHSYKAQCANGQQFNHNNNGRGTQFENYQTPERDFHKPHGNTQSEKVVNYNGGYNPGQNTNTLLARCPESFSGLMPHPSDCSKFLNCDHGRTHIMDCGPGTHFSPSLKVCDHIHNVKCVGGNDDESLPSAQSGPIPSYYPSQGAQPQSQYNGYQPERIQEPITEIPDQSQPTNNYNWSHSHQQQPYQNHRYPPYNPTQYNDGQQHFNSQRPYPISNNNDNQHQQIKNVLQQNVEDIVRVTTVSYETLTPAESEYKRKPWPPPFPTGSFNNDYVFEYDDLIPEADTPPPKNVTQRPVVLVNTGCKLNDFKCGSNYCISLSLVCNGKRDCPNGKDELDCDIRLKDFIKTAGTKLAVKEVNKLDNITLAWCAAMCANTNCKGFNYRKHDGTCYILDKNVALSGALIILPMYDYFENQVYASECDTNQNFLCQNQKCIPKDKLCNGVNNCGDGIDEKGCNADAFDYKIRLDGGPNAHSGHIELQVFGKKGYICDDMFGLRNADVACRELGFSLGAVEVRGNSYFAQDVTDSQTIYLMDDVTCIGNETSLRDCDFNGWEKSNCNPQEIVGVVCKVPTDICPKDYWKCENNLECLPLAFVCDGVYDCADKSDEHADLCEAPIQVRLTQGNKGRLEIMHNGIWGTVCDDDFNDDAAKVVCRQLGFNGSAKVLKDGQFGAGSGPIWLDQVYCKGNESAIDNCVHWDWGEHNCEHSEDVGVECNSFIGSSRNSHLNVKGNRFDKEEMEKEAKLPDVCGLRSDSIFANGNESPFDAHFRVVSAATAKIGEYPWQASIRVKGKTKAAHWCGAVVISSKYVLTAAHCLTGFSKGAYFIVAGDYNVDTDEGIEQEVYIDDFVTHPQFGQGNKMNNDIALVRLKGSGFNITKQVQPICLPPEGFDYPVGLNCTISGFGSIESGKSKSSRDLRAGWIPILSEEVCKMPHVYGTAITPGMLCAGYLENGVDACDGDSGGPLACLHEGVFKLFGITSWGHHCGYANKPGVYVNVSKYRKWIENTMKEYLK